MRVGHLISQILFLSSLVCVCFCKRDDGSFHVVGSAQCVDCKKSNLMTTQAFAGLHVTIDCKLKNGNMKRIGATELNNQGYFKVTIPEDIVHENGKNLKEKCYAQLHNAASMPCSAPNIKASKIVFKPSQHTFAPTKTLQFSATLCTSKPLWPIINPNHPWLKIHPWLKNHPWFRTPTPPTVTPPVAMPPVEPIPTPPVVTPPVEPLPPTTPEPPATIMPPVVSTPPSVPHHPFFKHPKTPCPTIPGHP